MSRAITSAQVAPVRIVGSSIVGSPPASLPTRSLGLGPFGVQQTSGSLPRLIDAGGQVCGVFVSEQLARRTAAALAQ